MSATEPDRWRLRHMIEACETIGQFVDGRQRCDLDTDRMLSFALLRAIEIIGEAAARLSPAFRSAYPDIPWSALIGMRNRLVHAYFDVDADVLWTAVTVEVPVLLEALHRIGSSE